MAEAASNEKIITLTSATQAGEARGVGESLWTLAMRRLRRDRLTMIAICILAFLSIMSISAPLFSRILNLDPDKVPDHDIVLLRQMGPELNPVWKIIYPEVIDVRFIRPLQQGHILGTDDLGRDHFLRLLYAGQISLGIAFTAALLAIGLGIALGV